MDHAGQSRISACHAIAGLILAGGLAVGGCDKSTQQRVGESGSIFAMIQPPTPAEAARWAVDPYDANKRMSGLNLLANAPFGGDPVYVKVYRAALGAPPADAPDSDPGVRAVAARALALHGSAADVDLILPLLKSPDRRVRGEAVRSLQRLHNPKAVEPLVTLTNMDKEEDVDVRAEACTALGQYAETKALQGLIAALTDDSLLVNRAAMGSLYTLTGQKLGEDPRAWLKWLEGNREPFANQQQYIYPHFERDKFWYEWIPLVPPPPNEQGGTPVGMTPVKKS